jgi:hypothetical protein
MLFRVANAEVSDDPSGISTLSLLLDYIGEFLHGACAGQNGFRLKRLGQHLHRWRTACRACAVSGATAM